jgi:hypothetical protein
MVVPAVNNSILLAFFMAARGRKSNAVGTHPITVSVSVPVYNLLRRIAQTGYSGRSEPAVAEEMIRKGLNADGLLSDVIKSKIIKAALRSQK